MALILDTNFHSGSLIENVSGTVFTSYSDTKLRRYDGKYCLSNSKVTTSSMEMPNTNHCISFSFRRHGRQSGTFITSIIRNYTTNNFALLVNGSIISLYYRGVDDVTYQKTITTDLTNFINKFNHWLISFNDKTIKVYINGSLYDTELLPVSPKKLSGTLTLNSNDSAADQRSPSYSFCRIFSGQLTDSEIANEYEYFQSLTSPIKPTHFNYKPKANQLTDGLVCSAYRAIGQTIIDEVRGNNSIRGNGFIDIISPIGFKVFFAPLNLTIPVINFNISINVKRNKSGIAQTLLRVNGGAFIRFQDDNNLRWYNGTTAYTIATLGTNVSTYQSISINIGANTIDVYIHGILNKSTSVATISSFIIEYIGDNTSLAARLYSTFKDISIYNRPLTAEEVLAYHKQFEYVTLHETFENYSAGQIYGDPYLTNVRPTVSELTTAQYGYEVGKKYLNKQVGFAQIKNNNAFGIWEYDVVIVTPITTVTRFVFIKNIRSNTVFNAYNGYGFSFGQSAGVMALLYNGTGILSTFDMSIFYNQLLRLKIIRTNHYEFYVYGNDVLLTPLSGSNPVTNSFYTFSECESINLSDVKLFMHKHTAL